jgi:hypothetical protein
VKFLAVKQTEKEGGSWRGGGGVSELCNGFGSVYQCWAVLTFSVRTFKVAVRISE